MNGEGGYQSPYQDGAAREEQTSNKNSKVGKSEQEANGTSETIGSWSKSLANEPSNNTMRKRQSTGSEAL